MLFQHSDSKAPPCFSAAADRNEAEGFGEVLAAKKIPAFWPGSLMLILVVLFCFQQKHSRLHSKIKEAKIKTEECVRCCHTSTNIIAEKMLNNYFFIFFKTNG